MIDADHLEQMASKVHGEVVGLRKEQITTIAEALRRGQAAERMVAAHAAIARVCKDVATGTTL